ncbi:MAG: alpha/beta hydrolase [Zavarzinia sp.]|nr:alpha/beta hydrolase [Zavarzinia sp.]
MAEIRVTLPDGIVLACDIVGDAGAPVVLPILGITDNMTDWPVAFARPFVEAGFRVIRFELRDMGRSSACEDRPPYDMNDVADDVLALIRHLGLGRVDVIGYSYGGAIGQRLALKAPAEVRSLTCLQSTTYRPGLPGRSEAVMAAMTAACADYPDEQGRIAAIRSLRLATGGRLHFMSETEAEESARRSVARAYVPAGTARLVTSRQISAPIHDDLPRIACPVLVLQGEDDPIFPLGHGEDIANRIPGARLLHLAGAGHNHPRSLRDRMLGPILGFLKTL